MYRYRETPTRYVPGCYGFKYMAYNIFTGIKTERLQGMDHYHTKATARTAFLELISEWNGQAYGTIQYWAID